MEPPPHDCCRGFHIFVDLKTVNIFFHFVLEIILQPDGLLRDVLVFPTSLTGPGPCSSRGSSESSRTSFSGSSGPHGTTACRHPPDLFRMCPHPQHHSPGLAGPLPALGGGQVSPCLPAFWSREWHSMPLMVWRWTQLPGDRPMWGPLGLRPAWCYTEQTSDSLHWRLTPKVSITFTCIVEGRG